MVGLVETYGRTETEAQVGNLEVIPRRRIEYRGVTLEEMDVDTIIRRKPELCVVDELAHSNVPATSEKIFVFRVASHARCENPTNSSSRNTLHRRWANSQIKLPAAKHHSDASASRYGLLTPAHPCCLTNWIG